MPCYYLFNLKSFLRIWSFLAGDSCVRVSEIGIWSHVVRVVCFCSSWGFSVGEKAMKCLYAHTRTHTHTLAHTRAISSRDVIAVDHVPPNSVRGRFRLGCSGFSLPLRFPFLPQPPNFWWGVKKFALTSQYSRR